MSKRTAFLLSLVASVIVAGAALWILSKVEISVDLGVAILIAFGVWGLVRGALYTATGTHIVVGWWRRIIWHLVPLLAAGSILVFVGGVKLGGKGGWALVEAGLDTIPGVSTAKAYELRRSGETAFDRLILSPVKGLWTTATAPVAKEVAEIKKLLASLGASAKEPEIPAGNVAIYAGRINTVDGSLIPFQGFEFGLKVDGIDTKLRSAEKPSQQGYASIFYGTDLKAGISYDIFVTRWSSTVPEKDRKEVKQSFTWKGETLTFQLVVSK